MLKIIIICVGGVGAVAAIGFGLFLYWLKEAVEDRMYE